MSYRVLVVDDSKLARMAVAKVLRDLRADWQLLHATNADEALALAHEASFDIALLDFNMPGRDGLSLAADLQEAKPGMPVAVISANLQDEIVARSQQDGAAFLPKPLTRQAMNAFICEAERRLGESRS